MKRKNAHIGIEVIVKATSKKGNIQFFDERYGEEVLVRFTNDDYEWYQLKELKLANKVIVK